MNEKGREKLHFLMTHYTQPSAENSNGIAKQKIEHLCNTIHALVLLYIFITHTHTYIRRAVE